MTSEASTRRVWTRGELAVLVGMFYTVPFSAGDDESEENLVLARELGRTRGAIDMQWRNTQTIVRGGSLRGISKTLQGLVAEYRDHPVGVVGEAIGVARKSYPGLLALLPDESTLDERPFAETFARGDDAREDAIALQLSWRDPRLATCRSPAHADLCAWIARELDVEPDYLHGRIRTVFAVRNGACVDSDERFREEQERMADLLEHDPVELRRLAEEACRDNRWHLWTCL